MDANRWRSVVSFMIRLVTFLGGFYFFLEFLLPNEFFGFSFAPYHEFITNGIIAVGVAAIGLGLISILRVHGVKILKGSKGWFPSTLLLASMFAMIFVTGNEAVLDRDDAKLAEQASLLREFANIVYKEGGTAEINAEARTAIALSAVEKFVSELPTSGDGVLSDTAEFKDLANAKLELQRRVSYRTRETLPDVADGLAQVSTALRTYQTSVREASTNRKVYNLLYQGLWTALAAAMFSLLGFYIAAAAYRAFRVRSMESALMMGAAVIVMLGQIPFGVWLYDGLPALRSWLLSVPSSAAFRAIRLGAGVAALLMAIRMWLSLDRRGGKA